jgi:DNA-binding SARP family transcriptional activator/tetratricopeptide (TPR) repeat protein
MTQLSLALLGGFEATLGPRTLTFARKAQALLAFLALSRGYASSRAQLTALLWAERGEEQARNSLRQMLFDVRKALGPDGAGLLRADHERIELCAARLEVDAVTFQELAKTASAEALARAVALYRGELLAGLAVKEAPFESWLAGERERLNQLAVRVLSARLEHQRAERSLDAVIQTALRLLALDPLQEPGHRALMKSYVAQGNRALALRQYQICVDTLRRELRVEPEAETRQVYREILAQRSASTGPDAGHGISERREDSPSAGDARESLRLVGRAAELARLRRALTQAYGGQGGAVALLGEAGIGKTRLVDEMAHEASLQGFRLIAGRAHESERILPFGLWIGALRAGGVLVDRESLEAIGTPWRRELARLFPELGARGAARSGLDDHLRIFEAVAALLTVLARRRPILIVLEDLHWADDTSLRLAAFLARRLAQHSVCIALTARGEELEDSSLARTILGEIARGPGLAEIALPPLDRTTTLELVHILASRLVVEAGGPLEERVWRMSEGNPLAVVEAMRTLHERGGVATETVFIPEGVRRVVSERLDRVGPRARNVLGAAAVIGRDFDVELLHGAVSLQTGEVADAVEELVRRRILCQRGGHLDFTHDSLREIAYEGLLEPRRRLFHAAVADAIERYHARDLEPHRAALAEHCRRAQLWDKAAHYLRATASQAADRGAYRDAVALLEDALSLLDHLAPRREVLEQAADMQLEASDLLHILGDFPRGLEHLNSAEGRATELDDEFRLARIRHAMARLCWMTADHNRAIGLGEWLIATGERRGDAELTGLGYLHLGVNHQALGDYHRAIDFNRKSQALFAVEPRQNWKVPRLAARTWLALSLAAVGGFPEAVSEAENAVADAEASEFPMFALCFTTLHLGWVFLQHGRPDRAIPPLERSHSLARMWHMGVMQPAAAGALGHAYVLAGRHAALGEIWPPPRPVRHAALTMVEHGECFLALGRTEEASALAHDALEHARQFCERGNEARALAFLATVEARRAGAAGSRARELYEQAMAMAEELGMRPLVARCQLGAGGLLLAAGLRVRAREHLERAAATFRELDMPCWLTQAESALRGQAGTTGARSAP